MRLHVMAATVKTARATALAQLLKMRAAPVTVAAQSLVADAQIPIMALLIHTATAVKATLSTQAGAVATMMMILILCQCAARVVAVSLLLVKSLVMMDRATVTVM